LAQSKLYVTAFKQEAEQIFAALERVFDEDGYPLSLTEIDEEQDVFEVSIYVDEAEQAFALSRFAQAAARDATRIHVEVLPDIDWVHHALEGLKPVRAGRFFVHGSHDRAKLTSGLLGIEIDAALAFGTGHHGTTAGCLEMISYLMRREKPRRILDLGTGSGVLAIGMAKLGILPRRGGALTPAILASDCDKIASSIARENMSLNKVASKVRVVTASGFGHRALHEGAPFDLIVANILARPLMKMAPQMACAVGRHGSVILSGILDKQRESVLAAYRGQGLFHRCTLHRSGWVTIFLRKSGTR